MKASTLLKWYTAIEVGFCIYLWRRKEPLTSSLTPEQNAALKQIQERFEGDPSCNTRPASKSVKS